MNSSLCRRCQDRHATTSLEVFFEGQRQEWTVCLECLTTILGNRTGEGVSSPTKSHTACHFCGWTEKDWRRTKKLGCPTCYVALDSFLTSWRKKEGYLSVCEDPSVSLGNRRFDQQRLVQKLQTELERAVCEERYENAALLRDKLKRLVLDKENG